LGTFSVLERAPYFDDLVVRAGAELNLTNTDWLILEDFVVVLDVDSNGGVAARNGE